jgi:hypothetical protein
MCCFRKSGYPFIVAVLVVLLSTAFTTFAQPGKGFQILLMRGMQMQGLSQWNDYWTYSTYTNANYSSVNWGGQSRPEWMAPGMLWSRWAFDETQMPPQDFGVGDEAPIMSQLFALQLADEWNLIDDNTRTRLVNWFNNVRSNFPNTILFHNNYGGQVPDQYLGDFISRAHPDMLCWDTYPFRTDGSGNPISGPPVNWYGDLWRYRQWGISTGLPVALYRQCYHSTAEQVRDPSPSELRLMTSMALAFNYKMVTDFEYNAGATSLFTIDNTGYNGDTGAPKPLYNEMIDVNKRALNLGKALIRLTPAYDLHNQNTVNPGPGPISSDPCVCLAEGITTGIMFLQGRYLNNGTTNLNSLPINFQSDPQSSPNPNNQFNLIYSWWESGKNDPYLNGWSVTNKGGVKNNGLIGDVILAWFHPTDDGYSPAKNTNEIYLMVVNGLSDATGTAADCMQEIKLNFLVGTNVTAVEMLDPVTGNVTTNTMPVIAGSGSSTKRQLVLDLNGGDAALFKYSDGVPFVTLPVAGKLSANAVNGQTTFTLRGPYAAKYRIEYSSSLTAGSWSTLTNVQVSAATGNVTFTDPAGSAARFYRAVALP